MKDPIISAPRSGSPLGVWLHSLHGINNRQDMRRMVERMTANGIDILFVCVKQVDGSVDFPSSFAQQSDWSKERDILDELLTEAHAVGLKVHAWLCNFIEGHSSALLNAHPEYQAMQNHPAKGLQSTRPDLWATSNQWACSNQSAVLDYEYALMAEVMERYPVDGVHFDYVRSGFYQCYCDFCQAECRRLTGADLLTEMGNFHPKAAIWYDYRAQNITSLVRRVGEQAHMKGLETSAAVFSTFPLTYNEQAQDWPLWLREGYLDLAIPMTYSTIPAETYYYTISHVAQACAAGKGELWQGVQVEPTSPELLQTIVQQALTAGAPGLVFFEYPYLTDEKFAAIHAELPLIST